MTITHRERHQPILNVNNSPVITGLFVFPTTKNGPAQCRTVFEHYPLHIQLGEQEPDNDQRCQDPHQPMDFVFPANQIIGKGQHHIEQNAE